MDNQIEIKRRSITEGYDVVLYRTPTGYLMTGGQGDHTIQGDNETRALTHFDGYWHNVVTKLSHMEVAIRSMNLKQVNHELAVPVEHACGITPQMGWMFGRRYALLMERRLRLVAIQRLAIQGGK